MKRLSSAYLAIIRLQNPTTLNIVCVWQIYRSHHLAKRIIYEILTACEQVRRWACVGVWYRGRGSSALGSVVVGVGEGPNGELVLDASKLCGVGDWYYRRPVVGSSVTLVSDTSCSTGTFVYCTGITVQSVFCLLL